MGIELILRVGIAPLFFRVTIDLHEVMSSKEVLKPNIKKPKKAIIRNQTERARCAKTS